MIFFLGDGCYFYLLVIVVVIVIFFIFQECDAIAVTKAGKLRLTKPNKYWVESCQKRVRAFCYPMEAGRCLFCLRWENQKETVLLFI